MRRVPRRLRAVSSVATVMTSLLIAALPCATSARAYERSSEAAPSPVGLPVIPSVLASGRSCT